MVELGRSCCNEQMIEIIEGLPGDTIGVRLVGKIAGTDYESVLIPALEAARADHDTVNVLAVIGPEFESYEPAALWDDTRYGVRNLHGWGRIAIVSDRDWIRHLVSLGRVFVGERMRLFAVAALPEAQAWATGGTAPEPT
jgi:stage II sporulation SpoAA-like protein